MQVVVHKNFEKDIEKYASPANIQEIFSFMEELEGVKSLLEMKNIKKLAGFKNIYRYRLGDFRIGFRLNEQDMIQLDRFLHRKDIYKKYP